MLNPSDTSQKEPRVLHTWRDPCGECRFLSDGTLERLVGGSWYPIRPEQDTLDEFARLLSELSTAQERAERAEKLLLEVGGHTPIFVHKDGSKCSICGRGNHEHSESCLGHRIQFALAERNPK